VILLSGLDRPHGITYRCTGEPADETPQVTCTLYVAETDAVKAYAYDKTGTRLVNTTGKKILDLPSGGGHFTRTIMFRPYPNDTELLVSVGSSCNVCNESDDRRATIQAVNVETGKSRSFAKGLRNAVFLATHPVTGDIWVTEMGRDRLGDDLPPDEVNIVREGNNYGWPICYGKNIHDTDFDKNTYVRNPCMEPFETPSHIDLQAHSAPLGIAFVPEEGWPEDWWFDAIVAYHGSWNRSVPTGYKLVRIKLDARGNYEGIEDFVTGWLTAEGALGRPVDVVVQPGGTMYVSDDKAGVIYLVRFRGGT
jgi:glucose/arabinose dehydrogenase